MKLLIKIALLYTCFIGCKNPDKGVNNFVKMESTTKPLRNKFGIANLHSDKFSCYYDSVGELVCTMDSVNFKTVHDDARWRIYCSICDHVLLVTDSAKVAYKLIDTMTYGVLSLKLYRYKDFSGELDDVNTPPKIKSEKGGHLLVFAPCFNDSPACYLFENKAAIIGVSRTLHNYCQVALIYANGELKFPIEEFAGSFSREIRKENKNDRLAYPLQPEVINYIRANKNKINPWFHKQAIINGVFDSVKYPPAKIASQIAYRMAREVRLRAKWAIINKRKAERALKARKK